MKTFMKIRVRDAGRGTVDWLLVTLSQIAALNEAHHSVWLAGGQGWEVVQDDWRALTNAYVAFHERNEQ